MLEVAERARERKIERLESLHPTPEINALPEIQQVILNALLRLFLIYVFFAFPSFRTTMKKSFLATVTITAFVDVGMQTMSKENAPSISVVAHIQKPFHFEKRRKRREL